MGKYVLLILALLNMHLISFGQLDIADKDDALAMPTMRCDNLTTIEKAKELVNYYQSQGYEIYHGGFFNLKHRTLCPVVVHLRDKKVYHIIVVGQPELNYMEVALGHDAFGTDEIRDRIRKKRDNTFFTHFAYTPPFEGNYLLSVTEDVKGRKNFCTAIYILMRTNNTSNNGN
jgi:hypothetical protein